MASMSGLAWRQFCYAAAGLRGVCVIGRLTENLVPVPGLLSTLILPLCMRTMCLARDKPSPVPPRALDLDLSTT